MVLVAPPLAEERLGRSGRNVRLLPYHRFEITSPLKQQDALSALSTHLEPSQWFRFRWPNSANDKRFEGAVWADGFEVRRITGYNNSFLPTVRGEVRAAGVGSIIQVTMRPFTLVIGFFVLVLLAGISGIAFGGGDLWAALLLIVILYVMVMVGFWFEASKQERVLREIFRAL